jgi:S-adenosylmethionine hydrolase
MMKKNIVILTDFGTTDPFVGIMKGVISGICPESQVIDLSHEIPPGDIQLGAIMLWKSFSFFTRGTVFLVVVDPGVGTMRRPIILETQGYSFVGPDNGIFTYILGEDVRAWKLDNPALALPEPRETFHGRDIFSPGAAYAARGVPGSEFGPPVQDIYLIPYPRLVSPSPGVLEGEIIHIDRFGNCLTSLGVFNPRSGSKYSFHPWVGETTISKQKTNLQDVLKKGMDLEPAHIHQTGGGRVGWVRTFTEIEGGNCGFLVGSSGLIEIVANRQSAAKLLNLGKGDSVRLIT